ncbi:hypothetical protein GS597_11130 [Synechococcales cyanobacterium C]|uniref:Lipid-A-disaccharide synthase n=1 Tax=Petrachloros mirabilis ULC683 TaxID=2781853 RepID=A0A8K1ZXD9_9CYAN|nr:lipid-A-disaccharide synthase-related protein [Petrachloros mirabilis]NCJ07050.1 hypothetical protein [Petrachloros mirabilis ULC683]
MNPTRLLVISNGHGEDEVAVNLVQALGRRCSTVGIQALPLVGTGVAYQQEHIPCLAPGASLPSGGFWAMNPRRVWQDWQGGLWQFTRHQLEQVRTWVQRGGKVLAVGDSVPLLYAWWSGTNYAFVGTAKSQYYRNPRAGETEYSPRFWERGCVYYPWERWLMQQPRCHGVFPRDRVTSDALKRWPIPVFDLGNPMLDGLDPTGQLPLNDLDFVPDCTILLLPGSRSPEAYRNWGQILAAIAPLTPCNQRFLFLSALAPALELPPLQTSLISQGWQPQAIPASLGGAKLFRHHHSRLVLTSRFGDCLHQADLAIAMAGTATEQCVGMGKPVISMPGQGPQFTPTFAHAQARLLGANITLLDKPEQVPTALAQIRQTSTHLWQQWGRDRMGLPGAADRIASVLQSWLEDK